MAGMKKYRFAGLNRDVWLPDDIRVDIRIITSTRFRSYQPFSGQNKTTWHDTGNPNTNEEGEWTWANNGRPGGEVGGYNFITGDKHIIQCAPLNEVTWAAGTPEGNTYSWHTEQAFGGGINFDNSLYTTAALHGGLIAAMGWNVSTSLVKHQYWYGKWCPGQILNKGLWPTVVNMVEKAAERARAAAGGTSLSDAFKKGSQAITTDNLNVRQGSNTKYKIMMTLPKGTKVTIKDGPRTEAGYTWYDLDVPGKGSGWAAENWLEPVKASTPAPAKPASPTYLKPLGIPELDKYVGKNANTLPAYVDFDTHYRAIWVGDRVETTEEQKRLRKYDGTEKELVGDWIHKGEQFDVDWLIVDLTNPKYASMYRTPWGTFVWVKNTKRVNEVRQDSK